MVRKDSPYYNAFRRSLREINLKICKHKLEGKREYFTLEDLRQVFNKWRGCCALCGVHLRAQGNSSDSARFELIIPLKNKGQPVPSNLIPVCGPCKQKKNRIKSELLERYFDYNAFSDLIVQLVYSVIEKDEKRINYFKYKVDCALEEFVTCLAYLPEGLKTDSESLEYNESISEIVKQEAEKLVRHFQNIGVTKEYKFTKPLPE